MNSLIGKAVTVWKSQGTRQLLNEVWKFVFDTLEDRSSGYLRWAIVQLYWLPYGVLVKRAQNGYLLHNIATGEEFYIPQLEHHRRFRERERKKLQQLYFDSEFAPLKEGDIVFDVGAFVGVSSVVAADKADKVYAIEASPRSYDCLEMNTATMDNIEPLHYAVYDQPSDIEFQLGIDASDDSILLPDEGESGQTEIVSADTIQNIANDLNISQIDLLKIEVEGVEPEAIDGIGNIDVRKVVTNCDAERDGEKTDTQVKRKLSEQGYEVTEGNHPYYTIVYGRKEINTESYSEDSKS